MKHKQNIIKEVTTLFKRKKYNIGYALSGGGIKGLCHAGVLRAMEDVRVKPDIICGVSAGAIVGALYCDGYLPEEIAAMFKNMNFRKMTKIQRPKAGLFSMEKVEDFLKQKLRAKTFEELRIPLKIVATNFETGEIKIFQEGNLLDAIVASCSIPILFVPKKIGNEYFVDGGVVKNFPVSILRNDCEYVIGVNLSPAINNKFKESIPSVILRSYKFMLRANIISDRELCDILIEPKSVSHYEMFEVERGEDIYNIGYDEAKEMISSKLKSEEK